MGIPVCVVAAGLLGIVLLAVGSPEGGRLTRRAWARLFVLGATGVSLLPGCRASRAGPPQDRGDTDAPPDAPPDPPFTPDPVTDPGPPIERWARLGRVWRALNALSRSERYGKKTQEELAKVKAEMVQGLDALPAWAELRVMFEERAEYVDFEIGMREAVASGITCYEMVFDIAQVIEPDVAEQVNELRKLVDEGKLSQGTAEKAAEALAVQAEVLRKAGGLVDLPGEERYEIETKLWEDYREGRIEAGPGAELAGKRLTELTVEELGLLAGAPQENEGMTFEDKEPDTPQEDAEQ
jgi:hypothetical protein